MPLTAKQTAEEILILDMTIYEGKKEELLPTLDHCREPFTELARLGGKF
jgi:hypothetical protein